MDENPSDGAHPMKSSGSFRQGRQLGTALGAGVGVTGAGQVTHPVQWVRIEVIDVSM
jgi:hypothetical protein